MLSASMTGARPRRHNAPVNPRRKPTVVSDVLLTLGSSAGVMGAAFFGASFGDSSVADNDAGRQLARLFAATLLMAGTLTFLLGVGLLRSERGDAHRYFVPLGVGAAIGALETVLFLAAAGMLLLAPYLLIVFILHPVRRLIARLLPHHPGHKR